jgi:hypothetical protein
MPRQPSGERGRTRRRCPDCDVPLHPGAHVCLACGAQVKFGRSVRQMWVSYARVGDAVIVLLVLSGAVAVLIWKALPTQWR